MDGESQWLVIRKDKDSKHEIVLSAAVELNALNY